MVRRERDSNPRYLAVYTLSRRASSATPAPLLKKAHKEMDKIQILHIGFLSHWHFLLSHPNEWLEVADQARFVQDFSPNL